MGKNDIQFSLLENGLDFVVSALDYLEEDQPENIKYAILHLSAGIELIFKERLRCEDWTLLFSKIEAADEQLYQNGDFHSVDFEKSIKRLEENCGVEFLDEHKEKLRILRKKRNKFEHFRIIDSSDALKVILADVLDFLIDFISSELMDQNEEEYELIHEYMQIIREKALGFHHFVERRMESVKPILQQERIVLTCPRCGQEAGIFDSDCFNCVFCNYSNSDSHRVANEYIYEVLQLSDNYVKDGGEWPLYYCPSCENRTLVHDTYKSKFICFSCADFWQEKYIRFCESCGNPFIDYYDPLDPETSLDPEIFCDDCLDEKLDKWG